MRNHYVELLYKLLNKGEVCLALQTYGKIGDESRIPVLGKAQLSSNTKEYIFDYSKDGFQEICSLMRVSTDEKYKILVQNLEKLAAAQTVGNFFRSKRKRPFEALRIKEISFKQLPQDGILSQEQVGEIIENMESSLTATKEPITIKKMQTRGRFSQAIYFVYTAHNRLRYVVKVLESLTRLYGELDKDLCNIPEEIDDSQELKNLHQISQSPITRDLKALKDPEFPRLPQHQAFYHFKDSKDQQHYLEVLSGVEGKRLIDFLPQGKDQNKKPLYYSQPLTEAQRENYIGGAYAIGRALGKFHLRYAKDPKAKTLKDLKPYTFNDFHFGNVLLAKTLSGKWKVSIIDLEKMADLEWSTIAPEKEGDLPRGSAIVDIQKMSESLTKRWMGVFNQKPEYKDKDPAQIDCATEEEFLAARLEAYRNSSQEISQPYMDAWIAFLKGYLSVFSLEQRDAFKKELFNRCLFKGLWDYPVIQDFVLGSINLDDLGSP